MGNSEKASTKQAMLVNIILDRSGSMGSTRQQTVDGFNEYVNGLRADGATDYALSLVQFDCYGGSNEPALTVNYIDKALADVPTLTLDSYQPRGTTPLYDAIGECVRRVDPKGRPVTVVIITDGMENASREFTQQTIKALIADKETQGWKFVFIGADIDSFAVAGAMGIDPQATANYAKGNENALYASLSTATADFADRVSRHGVAAASRMAMFDGSQRSAMMGRPQSDPAMLTPDEVAKKLKVTRRTVYSHMRSGQLPASRVGRQWRVREEDLP